MEPLLFFSRMVNYKRGLWYSRAVELARAIVCNLWRRMRQRPLKYCKKVVPPPFYYVQSPEQRALALYLSLDKRKSGARIV